MEGVVIDTNVFVAAAFNPKSAAARVVDGVREGRFRLIWNAPTRGETEMVQRRIPRIDWRNIADLFRPQDEFTGLVEPAAFTAIPDPDDREFAALSAAVGAPLITSDKLVIAQRGKIGIEVLTPREFLVLQIEE
jgi:predicted nucleic acid-binding protein